MEKNKELAIQNRIKKIISQIDLNPQNTDNYLKLSKILLEQKAFTEVIELLQRAQPLVDQPMALEYNLAVAYYYDEQYENAIKILDGLVVDDAILYQKALIYFKLGETKKALAFILTIKEKTNSSLELLADLWLALGNTKEAIAALSQIEDSKRTSKVWFMLGVSQSANSKKSAEQSFKRAKVLDEEYFVAMMKQYESILTLVKGNKDD